MKYWVIGAVLTAIAAAALYASSASSVGGSNATTVLMLVAVVAVLGVFAVITNGVGHKEEDTTDLTRNAWNRSGATIAVSLLGVVAVLGYVGVYAGSALLFNIFGYIIYVGVGLTFLALILILMLTGGKVEGES